MTTNQHPALGRREFLQASALNLGVAATATAMTVTVQADDAAPLPIIDTHQHLWDLAKQSLPWLKTGSPLKKSFVTKDYLAQTAGLNIRQAIYMEVDVAADEKVAEADGVLALTKDPKNLTCAAVIGGRPADAGFADYIARYKDDKRVIGVRQVLHGDDTKAGYCLEKPFVKSVQLLGKLGKTFDLCLRPMELADGAKLIEQCPDTRFILDHCGNGPVAAYRKGSRDEKAIAEYQRGLSAIAKHERVICKISGIAAQLEGKDWGVEALAPLVNICYSIFGPDRVIFASDWPVCTLGVSLKDWVGGLKEIVSDRSLEQQKRLFHDNAKKFYGV